MNITKILRILGKSWDAITQNSWYNVLNQECAEASANVGAFCMGLNAVIWVGSGVL